MTIYPQRLLLLGSGELGKEITIEAQRLGCQVIACDRYGNAPAMQVADIFEIIDMNNEEALKRCIEKYKPNLIVPEIEAIAVNVLSEIETKGITVIPTAKATAITMNRDRIRNLASEILNLRTARFSYATNVDELEKAISKIGLPVLVKPVMSSSGKGQSFVETKEEINRAWKHALEGARGLSEKVIIEEFINFDLEITLLTIRQKDGSTIFCDPIGHEQINGDYQSSWQPADMKPKHLHKAQEMAKKITEKLGGIGLFGVEFFIRNDEVIFSELSPRPHDTGLVTIISQNMSEFELHLRAILGLPIPNIEREKPSASRVILATKDISSVAYEGLEESLSERDTKVLLFGKPYAKKGRRMGVGLAKAESIEEAILKANNSANAIKIIEKLDSNYDDLIKNDNDLNLQ